MNLRLTRGHWLTLSDAMRRRLATIFGIRPSNATHVSDNVVVDDGFTDENLQAINVTTIQKYLESTETDFFKLFDALLVKVQEEITPKKLEVVSETPNDIKVEITINDEKHLVTPTIKRNVKKAKTTKAAKNK